MLITGKILSLLYGICVIIYYINRTHSCETWSLRTYDMKRTAVAWNNAFREIFNAYWYESVKPLQYQCSCLQVSIMLPMRKLLFWKKMLCSENVVLCLLAMSLLWLTKSTADLMTS